MSTLRDQRLAPLSVLIVDDNHHMLQITRAVLRGFGIMEVREATDAADAFEKFSHAPADLIVTDYKMEPLDGCEFTRMVRTAPDSPNPFVPIIMLSAYTEKRRVTEARDAGVTEFLSKPLVPIDLYRKLVAAIDYPRPFVRTPTFFGPDRRRHDDPNYMGPERRAGGMIMPPPIGARKPAAASG